MSSGPVILLLSALFSLTTLGATAGFCFWIIGRARRAAREGAAQDGVHETAEVRRDGVLWGLRAALALLLGTNARAVDPRVRAQTASLRARSPSDRRAFWELVLRQHIAVSVALALMFAGALITMIVSFASQLLR